MPLAGHTMNRSTDEHEQIALAGRMGLWGITGLSGSDAGSAIARCPDQTAEERFTA